MDKRDIEDSYINLKWEVVILWMKWVDKMLLENNSIDSMLLSWKILVERCEFFK